MRSGFTVPAIRVVFAATVALALAQIVSAQTCASLCTTSTWKSDACYQIDDTSCYYQRQYYCRPPRNPTEEALNCKSGAVNETCTISLSQTCSPVLQMEPRCGNQACEVGEPWTCPQDCAYYADGNIMTEGVDTVATRCPALNPSQRYFVITMDDGPTSWTTNLLSMLNQTTPNVKVTFFVVGSNIANYAGVVNDMVRQGHIIGTHTYSHFNISIQSKDNILNDIANSDQEIYLTAGYKPRFLRPPYGSFTKSAAQIYRNNSLDMVAWNIDSFDYKRADVDQITQLLEMWLQYNPGQGHLIYLGHDTSKQGVDVVPQVISLFQSKGFQPTTLDECIYGVRGPAVYSAPRSLEPLPVQKLIIPAGDDGLTSAASRRAEPAWIMAAATALFAAAFAVM